MFIGNRGLLSQVPPDVKIEVDGNFTPCKFVKTLGIHLDSFMLFDNYITEMSKKIYGIIMYINRDRDNFSKNSRIAVIQSLALSVISCGIKVWGTTKHKKVQKLQNFAAKLRLEGKPDESTLLYISKSLSGKKLNRDFIMSCESQPLL